MNTYHKTFKVVGSGWEQRIRQREYLPLISEVLASLLKTYGGRLNSVVLYGSVARGTARENSDLDILAVIEGLSENFSERIGEMMGIIRAPGTRR